MGRAAQGKKVDKAKKYQKKHAAGGGGGGGVGQKRRKVEAEPVAPKAAAKLDELADVNRYGSSVGSLGGWVALFAPP